MRPRRLVKKGVHNERSHRRASGYDVAHVQAASWKQANGPALGALRLPTRLSPCVGATYPGLRLQQNRQLDTAAGLADHVVDKSVDDGLRRGRCGTLPSCWQQACWASHVVPIALICRLPAPVESITRWGFSIASGMTAHLLEPRRSRRAEHPGRPWLPIPANHEQHGRQCRVVDTPGRN